MTYRQPAVCRAAGCGRPAVPDDGLAEGDRGWCQACLAALRERREEAWAGVVAARKAKAPARLAPQ